MFISTIRTIQNGVLTSLQNNLVRSTLDSSYILQKRCYAARKGTREKRKKAKVKVEVQKVGWVPFNQRDKEKFLKNRQQRKFDDSWLGEPIDDVFVTKYYKWTVYPFEEAVKCHRETHHPEMYNKPNANLHVSIELNMQGEKKTRFVENFSRIAGIPHKFDQGEERPVLAFGKTSELQKEAVDAGAQLSGGVELIKQIQNGQVSLQEFKYVVAHPDILPELVVLRGLMKKRFPNPKAGTLDVNMGAMVERFIHGINYTAVKDEYEKDFGVIETVVGPLSMDSKNLEENFAALVRDIYTMKPKRKGHFISRCILWSPPSPEKLKVDHNMYLDVAESKTSATEEEEEEQVGEKIAL
ncbi:hypothetical protein JTB14_017006 [Gonioctena quinquepunctata]|nr:hypothetical protein JTB14_017006 [Gonioctena quinquepunctata]